MEGCIHLSRARLPTETYKLTPAHIDLTGGRHARVKPRGWSSPGVCMRSSRRGRASAHANSLPNPLISGPRNAGALNSYRIAGSRAAGDGGEGSSGVLHLPSFVVSSLPRVLSLPFQCPLVHPSLPCLSLSLARYPHSFLVPFLPFRPQIVPFHRPLIPNVRTPAYTSLLLTTTLYY